MAVLHFFSSRFPSNIYSILFAPIYSSLQNQVIFSRNTGGLEIWIDRVVREAKQNMYKHLSKLSWLIISQKVLDFKLQSWILNTRIFQLQHSDVPAFSIHWPCCSWGSTCSCRSDCKINPMQRRFYMISVDQTAKLTLCSRGSRCSVCSGGST